MINCKFFCEKLNEIGIDFYTGVPDSLLKDICAYISIILKMKEIL